MASKLNEDLMNTNLDIPEGEIKIEGKVNPVYADAINVHNKKKKETEKVLKDNKPELKKPFLGTKGNTTITPKTKEMKKLKLAENMFKPIREEMADAPEAYDGIFRVIDNMEHIINYISELEEEELSYADMQQSYNVLDDSMREFEDYLFEIKEVERRNGTLKEATAVMDRKSWELKDKRNNKDVWSDIYNELVGMKGIEAPHRRLKTNDRYKASWGDNPDESDAIRVGASRDGGIVVKSDDLSDLDFAKEVAETYGVEWRVKEHTSRYADSKYELIIYPYNQVMTESLNEATESDIYSAVGRQFEYGAPSNTNEVVVDLVDRALSNIEEGYDIDEAIADALDNGLIYHRDLWAIKEYYEDSELADETYEKLYNDLYSIVSVLSDNDDMDESLNESYIEVDTITAGDESYRVVGGGFNSNDALVSVEDKDGNRKRLSSGDVFEFYTFLDRKGNVIREPEEFDESLKESKKSRTVVLDNFNDEYVNDPEFLSTLTEILGPDETYGGSIRQIKDFAITVTVDVGTDMTAGSYGCKFKALVDGDFDSDYASEKWLEFDLSRYDNLVYQCWWEKESGEDEYYPVCDVITMYRRDISSDIINAYLQVDGEAIMYMLEPIETALYDYVPASNDAE